MVIKAILTDLDGVLVVTPGLHEEALNYALRKVYGFELTSIEHDRDFNGLPTKTKLKMLATQGRVKWEDFEVVFALKQTQTFDLIIEKIQPNPDIISIGEHWKELGLTRVCVTNAIYPSALLMLDQVGILSSIQKIVTPEEMQAPKPHPSGYELAMEYADAKPNECVIVEDSPKGIEAAERSGCPNIWKVRSPLDTTVDKFNKYMETL